jgi:hypothetical protein
MQLDMRKTDVNSHTTVGSMYTVQHVTGASTLIVLEDKSAHRVRQ